MTYYKVLKNGVSCHGGRYQWPLPVLKNGEHRPGTWTPTIKEPKICIRGWHLTENPMAWPVVRMEVYEAQAGKVVDRGDDKIVTTRARLLRPVPEIVPQWWHDLEHFVQEEIPNIPYLQPDGKPDPSWHLSKASTWGAAYGAADGAAYSARSAAYSATYSAAYGAARSAAYGAARSAAYSATYSAARSAARSAAYGAARSAARSAPHSAADSAALYARTEFVCDGLPLAQEHKDSARRAWNVWQKGYALLCDVAGVLYVYAKE